MCDLGHGIFEDGKSEHTHHLLALRWELPAYEESSLQDGFQPSKPYIQYRRSPASRPVCPWRRTVFL